MKKNLFLIILFYVILKPSISFSLVEIDITRGNLDPMPISVSPFFSDKITDENIKKNLEDIKPDFIINCGAYTNVDMAESNKEIVMNVNYNAPKAFAKEIKELGGKFLQISTDYVFDGQKSDSYTETDKTNPINYYGKTKLLGEEIISHSDCRYLIFRISWLYSDYGKNFFKTISRLIQEKSSFLV